MKIRKILAFAMALVMLFSNTATVFAANETGTETSAQRMNLIRDNSENKDVEAGDFPELPSSGDMAPDMEDTDGTKENLDVGNQESLNPDKSNDELEEPVTEDESLISEETGSLKTLENESILPGESVEVPDVLGHSEIVNSYLSESLPGSGISLFSYGEWTGSFGEQIEDNQRAKELYDMMVANYINGDCTGEFSGTLSTPVTFEAAIDSSTNEIIQDENYNAAVQTVTDAFYIAFPSFIADYPQAFWIAGASIRYTVSASGTGSEWRGTISDIKILVNTYYEDTPRVAEYQTAVTEAVTSLEAGLGENATRYDKVKAIHDYLCKELEYDSTAASKGDATEYLYAHTSSTAFLGRADGEKTVVCEGYAKAFKVLCDQWGIPCVLVTGDGVGTDGTTEPHMWNYVQMEDEQWYGVDVTWDDQTSGIRYEYFLAGVNTAGFNKTFGEEHLQENMTAVEPADSPENERLIFSFVYPALSEEAYTPADPENALKAVELYLKDSPDTLIGAFDNLQDAKDGMEEGKNYRIVLNGNAEVSGATLGAAGNELFLNGYVLQVVDGTILGLDITEGTIQVPDNAVITLGGISENPQNLTDITWNGNFDMKVEGSVYSNSTLSPISLELNGFLHTAGIQVAGDTQVMGNSGLKVHEQSTLNRITVDSEDVFRIILGEGDFSIDGTVSGSLAFAKESDNVPVDFEEGTKIAQLNADVSIDNIMIDTVSQVYAEAVLGDDYILTARYISLDRNLLIWNIAEGEGTENTLLASSDSFSEALSKILNAEQERSGREYQIEILQDMALEQDDLNFPEMEGKVSVILGNHTLTAASANVRINTSIAGSEEQGCIVFPYAGIVSLVQSADDTLFQNLSLDFQYQASTLEAGREYAGGVFEENHVILDNVSLDKTNYVSLSLHGNVDMDGNASVYQASIHTSSIETGDGNRMETKVQNVNIYGQLTTALNVTLNGHMSVETLEVRGILYTDCESLLRIYRKGTVNGLNVVGTGGEWEKDETFRVILSYVTNGQTNVSELAEFAVNGNVSKSGSMNKILTFQKESTSWNDGEYHVETEDNFTAGDILATIALPEYYVPTGWFGVESDDEGQCVIREGNFLKVAETFVEVNFIGMGGMVEEVHRRYVSFEDAVRGISASIQLEGFGSMPGSYEFILHQDDCLKADVLIPSCVTEFTLSGVQGEQLDLNGHTITFSNGKINVLSDIQLKNGSIVAYASNSLRVSGDSYGIEPFYNMNIVAPNARFYLEAEAKLDLGETNLNVLECHVDCEVSAKSLTLNGEQSEITGRLTLGTLSMYASSLVISPGAEMNVGQVTVYSASPLDGHVDYRTILNRGGDVQVGNLYMAAGTLHNGTVYTATGMECRGNMEIQTVQLVINFENGEGAVFQTENFAQAYYGRTWMNTDSHFTSYGAGSVVIYNPVIAGSCYMEKSESSKVGIYGTVLNNNQSENKCMVSITNEGEVLPELEENTLLFTVSDPAFPSEMFEVLQQENGKRYALNQVGAQILIKEAQFLLLQLGSKGESSQDERELGVFATWQQAVDCINLKYNASADYIIRMYSDVNIEAALNLPVYAKSLIIENASGEERTLTYYGDIILGTDVTFRNLNLQARAFNYATWKYDLDYSSAVVLYSRNLTLENTKVSFTYVSGWGGSGFCVSKGGEDSVSVKQYISGVTNLKLSDTHLSAAGTVAATNLVMERSWLDAGGQTVLTTVVSNSENNKISYGGNSPYDTLYIYGAVSGSNEEVAEDQFHKVNAITVEPKSLKGNYDGEPWIMIAYQAPALWFVTEDLNGVKSPTSKEGVYVYARTVTVVALYADDAIHAYYKTVAEAFAEIQALCNVNTEYRVVINEDTATNYYQNLAFPSMASKLIIEAGKSDVFSFWSQAAIACDTEFRNLKLNTTYGVLYPGYFEMYLNNTGLSENARLAGILGAVTVSEFRTNTDLYVDGHVSGLKTLTVENGTLKTSRWGAVYADCLILGNGANKNQGFIDAGYYVTVTDISCQTEGCKVTTSAQLYSPWQIIYGFTPLLTIYGNVEGEPLTVEMTDGDKPIAFQDTENYTWSETYKANMGSEYVPSYVYKGICIANARYVSPEQLRFSNENADAGMLYKTNGYVAYMSTTDYAIDLCYDGTATPCLTWMDAITEINNLYQQREYIIRLKQDIGDASSVPTALALPAGGAAKKLTIEPEGSEIRKIYYYGNIVSYTNLELNHVEMLQKIPYGGKWILADDETLSPNPAPVYMTTVADLTFGDAVSFNTPMYLNGCNVSNLTFAANTKGLNSTDAGNVLKGTITGYLNVQSADDLSVDTYPVYYWWYGIAQAEGNLSAQTVTVVNHSLHVANALNAGTCLRAEAVSGNVDIHAMSIVALDMELHSSESFVSEIDADTTFTVYRNVESTGLGNLLATSRNPANAVPYLYIAGMVNTESPIQIRVHEPYVAGEESKPVILESSPSFISGILLTAPNTSAECFEASAENLREESQHRYEWKEGAEKTGYMLQKIYAAYINVYYADEIVAGVCKGNAADGVLTDTLMLGYYTSMADAVTEINNQADKDSEYTIVLLQDIGDSEHNVTPVTFGLPYNRNWVNIVSEKGKNYTIYYMNHVALNSSLRMVNTNLAPVWYNYAPAAWNIWTGTADLEFENVSMAAGTSVGYLTGYGKVSVNGGDLQVSGYLNTANVCLGESTTVTCIGSVALPSLVLEKDATLYGKSYMSIGNIELRGEGAAIQTARSVSDTSWLTIYGTVSYGENAADGGKLPRVQLLIEGYEGASAQREQYALSKEKDMYYGYLLSVPARKKLADIQKEYLSCFDVAFMGDSQVVEDSKLVKCQSGVYYVAESLEDNIVCLRHDENTEDYTYCLDLAQAAVEVAALASPYERYTIETGENLTDTNVTDGLPYSTWVLPSVYTAQHVTLTGPENRKASISFWSAYGMTCTGDVTLKNLTLCPVDYYGNAQGQYVTLSIAWSHSGSRLVMDRVDMVDGNYFYHVLGMGTSELTLMDSELNAQGVVQNIPQLTLIRSHLTTGSTAVLTSVSLEDSNEMPVQWDASGYVYVYGNLNTKLSSNDSYIATRQYGTSLFYLYGEVSGADKAHPIDIKVFDNVNTSEYISEDAYADVALLNATKADAGAFRAFGFKNALPDETVSYKDIYYCIRGGYIADMVVRLTREDSSGEMYAKSFDQAVNMINQAGYGVPDAEFTMTLLKGTETGVDSDGQQIEYVRTDSGVLPLPVYAKKLTIQGVEGKNIAIRYAGVVTPYCNLEFKNIRLDEGYQGWYGWVSNAPNINMGYNGYELILPKEVTDYTTIYAPYGTVILPDIQVNVAAYLYANTLEVNGQVVVNSTLSVSNLRAGSDHAEVTGKAGMTIVNILDNARQDGAVQLTTYRTPVYYPGQPAYTQLNISGQIEAKTDILMMLYDWQAGDWRPVERADLADMELTSSDVPTGAETIATVVKGSIDQIRILYANGNGSTAPYSRAKLWKYWQGLYMTAEELPIELTGSDGYAASYMTWEQAVYDINWRGQLDTEYILTLKRNIGNNGTIGNLIMPSYAKKVTITSDHGTEGNCIFFTYPIISLGCPTEFDRVGLIAVQGIWSGRGYHYNSTAHWIAAGNFDLAQRNMLAGGQYTYNYYNGPSYIWLNSEPGVIYGAGYGSYTYQQLNVESPNDNLYGNVQDTIGTQVSGFATFTLEDNEIAYQNAGSDVSGQNHARVEVKGIVTGITNLVVESDAELVVDNSVYVYNADLDGEVKAWNFVSSGTVTMDGARIDVSGYRKNQADGVIFLTHLNLEDSGNELYGRLNVYSQPQISIYGFVSKNYEDSEDKGAPVIVGSTYFNKDSWSQLYENAVLLTAPYVAEDEVEMLFEPRYSRTNGLESGMGTLNGHIVKSGWNIVYQTRN